MIKEKLNEAIDILKVNILADNFFEIEMVDRQFKHEDVTKTGIEVAQQILEDNGWSEFEALQYSIVAWTMVVFRKKNFNDSLIKIKKVILKDIAKAEEEYQLALGKGFIEHKLHEKIENNRERLALIEYYLIG